MLPHLGHPNIENNIGHLVNWSMSFSMKFLVCTHSNLCFNSGRASQIMLTTSATYSHNALNQGFQANPLLRECIVTNADFPQGQMLLASVRKIF